MAINFEGEYQASLTNGSDICEHLPYLSKITEECEHVTELGVGWAQSTRAFMRHDVVLHSYEFQPAPGITEFFLNARSSGRNVTLHHADTRTVEIEETDLLFVDSLHVYEQVKEELRLHADKARKYIVFHDTTTYAERGEFGGKGIWPAVQEFIDENVGKWELIERFENCNGLTVLKRV